MIKNFDNINDILFVPNESRTPIKIDEAEYIHNFLVEKNIYRTLEIGFGIGRSASHIITATNSEHIVIDPFQKNYQNMGIKNIQRLTLDNFLTLREDYSHNILPGLLREERKFDFIFIDGSHTFDGIFLDFYYSDLLLDKNGYILFHDAWMRSTQLVTSFVRKNRMDYIFVKTPLKNLVLIQKIGDDNRSQMFHREFYNFRSIISYNIKTWLFYGNDNFLKSFILRFLQYIK